MFDETNQEVGSNEGSTFNSAENTDAGLNDPKFPQEADGNDDLTSEPSEVVEETVVETSERVEEVETVNAPDDIDRPNAEEAPSDPSMPAQSSPESSN